MEKPLRILLIEDNHADARLIRELFAEIGHDFVLEYADKLSKGIEKLHDRQVDAILLDLLLPDSMGLDTFTKVHSQMPQAPVIVLTGIQDESLAMDAMRAGAQDYLIKGEVDGKLLARAIRYAIERTKVEDEIRKLNAELEERVQIRTAELSDANDSLFQSQQMLQLVLDTIPQSVFWKGRDLRFLGCNKAFVKNISLTKPEVIIGKTDFDLNLRSGTTVLGADDGRIIENDESRLNYEESLDRGDGAQYWLKTSKLPLHDKDGRVIGMLGVSQDITKERQIEEAIKKSESTLRSVLSVLPIGILLISPDRVINWINDKMSSMTGYSLEDIKGNKTRILYPTDDEFIIAGKIIYADISRGNYRETNTRWVCKDGRIIDIKLNAAPMDSTDLSLGLVCTAMDITEQKQAEARLERNLRETRIRLQVSQALAGNKTEEEVLDVLSQQLDIYPQAYVSIATFEIFNGELTAIARRINLYSSGLAMEMHLGRRFPVSQFEVINKYMANDIFVSENALIDERVDPNSRAVISQKGGTSLAVFRLKAGDDIMGVILALARTSGYFDEEKQNLYRTLAEQGAVAIRAARLRETIRESQQRFQVLVETLGDWVWEVDQSGIYTYVSPKIKNLLGYEPEELLGKTPFDFMPPEEARRTADVFGQLLKTQQPMITLENTNRHKDGHLVVFESSASPFFDSEGRFKGYHGTDRDITGRKQAEAILRQKTEEMDSFFNIALDLLCIADIKGNFRRVNSAWKRILGYETEEIEGKNLIDFVHPDDEYTTMQMVANLDEQPIPAFINRFRCKNGEYRWIEWHSARAGNILYVAARDITEWKNNEEILRHAKDDAESATRAKSEFLANISHEIRTPLNAIIGLSELLKVTVKDKKQQSYLTTINTSGKSLLMLINDILDLSKLEVGMADVNLSPVNLPDITLEIEEIFKLKVSEKAIDFKVEIDNDLPSALMLDQVKMRQVLLNLVGNAIKFTSKGYVLIKIERKLLHEGGGKIDLIITVEDSGIGIAEEDIAGIFESFKQSKGISRDYGGTGLGLAISKRLVESMGGNILVTSKSGAGSTFTVELYNVAVTSADVIMKKSKIFNLGEIRFNSGKVLIVDDIKSNRVMLREILKSMNLSVLEAKNGESGIKLADTHKPDLIILDIMMPYIDGIETIKRLKNNPNLRDIPVIALTAAVDMKFKQNILEHGFKVCLTKPVDIQKLLEVLTGFLPYSYISEDKSDKQKSVHIGLLEEIINIHDLVEKLTYEVMPAIEKAKGVIKVSDIKEIAMMIATLADKHRSSVLKQFSEKLSDAANSFDIKSINSGLLDFTNILKIIEKTANHHQ